MNFNIVTVPGDGIGPDVIGEAVNVLNAVGKKYGHVFNFTEKAAGGVAIDTYGCPLPQDTVDACKKSDSVLLGAVGGPKWDHLGGNDRPERRFWDCAASWDSSPTCAPLCFTSS